MKTVTYDETKWALVPLLPEKKQLNDTAFNLCAEFGYDFVSANERFARWVYSQMIANAPEPSDDSEVLDIPADLRRNDDV
jgi:hypothetical protein